MRRRRLLLLLHRPLLLGMLLNRARLIFSSRVAFSSSSLRRGVTTRTTTTAGKQFFFSPTLFSSSSAVVKDSAWAATTNKPSATDTKTATSTNNNNNNIVVLLSENQWRLAAYQHSQRIMALLRPGLLVSPSSSSSSSQPKSNSWTALDPSNPIFNFLIEYYGLKGTKGVRRLARWSPDPELLLSTTANSFDTATTSCGDIYHYDNENDSFTVSISSSTTDTDELLHTAAMEASHGLGGILLLNATMEDLGSILHLRGGVPVPYDNHSSKAGEESWRKKRRSTRLHGVLYNPSVFYNDLRIASCSTTTSDTSLDSAAANNNDLRQRTMASYQWYTSILETTLNSNPNLHCHGLHEWAMLYHPKGSDPPPSAAYQPNLPLRVPQHVINEAVERAGIRCTHVDALRFFAPDALPLNRHVNLTRTDQLHLEQKACVHAHMDLLKMALKLSSFVDSRLLGDVLELSLEARRLDVAASPYDASLYGLHPVPIETREGRKMYRREQAALMNKAEPIRRRLLRAYEVFMELTFSIH